MIRIRIVLLLLAYCIALLGFIPLFLYLDSLPRLLFVSAFAAGMFADYRHRYQAAIVTTAISLLFFIYYGLQFNRNNVVGPVSNIIILLLGVRLLSEKTVRNHLQIYVLAMIALAASSLYSLDAVFLVYLLVQLMLITVSLVLLTFHGKDSQMNLSRTAMKKVLSAALLMPLVTIPLTVFFFVILPRTQYPLWQFMQKPTEKVSGFSEKVEPGASPTTAAAKTVAFRAESSRLGEDQLYWRGIVLNQVVGDTWVRAEPPSGEFGRIVAGPAVRQTIYPEPSHSRYLVTLNIPQELTGLRITSSRDLIFSSFYKLQRRISYTVASVPGKTIPVAGKIHRNFYLKRPTGISPRMEALARELKRGNKDDLKIITALGDYFKRSGYTYLTSSMPTGSTSIDTFIFDQRRGNCELFAVSAATLLRLAGLPTRMVGGYFGGDYNPIGGYYTVTDDMAHVWLEVYLTGEGWVTVDPTQWSVNGVRNDRSHQEQLLRQFRMYLDLLGYYWNRAVITYDLEKQISLAQAANRNLKELKLSSLKVPLVMMLIVMAVIAVAPFIRTSMKKTTEEKLLSEFFAVVSKRFALSAPLGTVGLFELAEETGNPLVQRFVALYGETIYKGRKLTSDQREELVSILSQIRNGADVQAQPKGSAVPS